MASNPDSGLSGVDAWGDASPDDKGERYRERSLLGEGGMGRVVLAEDTVLRRDVALKEALGAPDSPEARRLSREARIIAALDHPGIVPVHDLGTRPDGRPFYVMRLVRGRTLTEALAADPDPAARRRLLRPFAAACEAVAFAHAAGVVHRDLKPDNLLLGRFGEMQVMDWGLTRVLSDDAWESVLSRDFKTRVGSVLGTPAWMSPEQAAGEPVTPASDVWALGAILFEILAGTRPFAGPSERELLAQILAGSRRSLRELAPDVDADLAAIVDRAMARQPADRYADAAELAAALGAWLDGQRPPRARRPLGLLALGMLALAAGWGLRAATGPEVLSVEARDVQEAQVLRARAASDAGDRATAELSAARALELGESPEARGIFARHLSEPLARKLSSVPLADCGRARLAPGGAFVLCMSGDTLTRHDPDGSVRWSLPVAARRVLMPAGAAYVSYELGGRSPAWYLDAGLGERAALNLTPGRSMPRNGQSLVADHAVTLQNGRSPELLVHRFIDGRGAAKHRPCRDGAGVEWAVLLGPEQLLVLCEGRSLRRVDIAAGTEEEIVAPDDPRSIAWVGELDPASGRLAIGGFEGDLELYDTKAPARRHRLQLVDRAWRSVSVQPGGALVAATDVSGEAWVVPVDEPAAAWRLPGRIQQLAFDPDGGLVVLRDGSREVWALPAAALPHRLEVVSGVTELSWTEGEAVVVAGDVYLLPAGGAAVQRLGGQSVWSATRDAGGQLWGASIERGLIPLDPSDTAPLSEERLLRLILTMANGDLVIGRDAPSPLVLDATGRPRTGVSVPGFRAVTGNTSADGRRALMIGRDDRLARIDEGAPPTVTVLGPLSGLHRAVLTPDGQRILGVDDGGVFVRDAESFELLESWRAPGAMQAVPSPDGRLLALGYLDGRIEVVDAERTVLGVLLGHGRRVGALAFSPDGRQLLSGSWDRTVQRWDIEALTAPRAELVAGARARWAGAE